MLNMQASTQRVAVILNSSFDWDEWIGIIMTKAIAGDIWDYVNPNTAKDELPVLAEPHFPMPAEVNTEKTTFATLDVDEKEELQALRH